MIFRGDLCFTRSGLPRISSTSLRSMPVSFCNRLTAALPLPLTPTHPVGCNPDGHDQFVPVLEEDVVL